MPYKNDEEREEAKKHRYKRMNEWQKENVERISIVVPKGTKERITGHGYTVNKFVNEAIAFYLVLKEKKGYEYRE